MRLACLVCKRDFQPFDRFVTLTGQESGGTRGTKQGVSLACCSKHLSQEMVNALLLNNPMFCDYTQQVYAEKLIFGNK